MTNDTLSSPQARELSYCRFLSGIEIVKRTLDVALKTDSSRPSVPGWTSERRMQNPDAFFEKLFSSVYSEQEPVDPRHIDFRALHNSAFLPSDWILDELIARLSELHALSDKALLDAVISQFDVASGQLQVPADGRSFTYLKINHGFWEHLTKLLYANTGAEFYRPIGLDSCARYYASGFVPLLSRTLCQKLVVDKPQNCNRFIHSDFEFGISFNNGDFPYQEDLKLPLGLVQRGAMLGSLAYFKTIMGPKRLIFSDGAGPKQLARKGGLKSFVAQLSKQSDCVVFIVPRHLRNIELTHTGPRTVNILIPSMFVHELWSVVLPYVAGTMNDVLREFRNVTVFIQAGVMSAPIGILIDKMRRQIDDADARQFNCVDLGQVLDLAIPPERQKPGRWSQRAQAHESADEVPFSAQPLR